MQRDDCDFRGLCHFIARSVQHQQCIQLENDLYCTACYFYLLQYEISVGNCSFSVKKTYLESGGRRCLSKYFGSGGGFHFSVIRALKISLSD